MKSAKNKQQGGNKQQSDNKQQRGSLYQSIDEESFTVEGTRLRVEDRINLFLPWCSERILWIDGTDAYYSVAPLCPAWHSLLSFTYCEDIMKSRDSGYFKNALALGCGGGAVPRWMLEEYPSLHVDVVDRSPEIIRVCKKYFLKEWEDSDRLQYYLTDARDYEPPAYPYQFIFCDLFNGKELAPVVYDSGFAKKLREMTDDDGLLVINCGWHHLKEVRRLYQAEFTHFKVLDREPWQTEVVMASSGELPDL